MIRLGQALIVVAGALLLYALMSSKPDYDRTHSLIETTAASGEVATTRLLEARFDGWRSADRLAFSQFGRTKLRDTQGRFLILDLTLTGTTRSTLAKAVWIGASGRQYATTLRIADTPRQIETVFLQPGLAGKAVAIFELPPDEIAGGRLLLVPRVAAPLDGALLLDPPATPPAHETQLELGP